MSHMSSSSLVSGPVVRQTLDHAPLERAASPVWTEPGTARFQCVRWALFLAGFSTFSLIYAVQPVLPNLVADFGVSPSQSSLALSLTTGFLAFAIFCAGAVSESAGRRGLMCVSMTVASVLHIAGAMTTNWALLLTLRAGEGIVLGGVPAVAMAYLAEEIHPRAIGTTMGLYIGGSAFGGMMGRIGIGVLTAATTWRTAQEILGLADFAAALGFFLLLPRSRNFVRHPGMALSEHCRAWLGHLRNHQLALLFLIGFLSLGVFVATFNYMTFRLTGAPYGFDQAQISMIFLAYLFGSVASPAAGRMADRFGRGRVMTIGVLISAVGALLSLSASLVAIGFGIAGITIGFFTVHSVASAWVGRLARAHKGHASSLYLLAYYVGSSAMGVAGGWFWSSGGWPAVVSFIGGLLAIALVVALWLWHRDTDGVVPAA